MRYIHNNAACFVTVSKGGVTESGLESLDIRFQSSIKQKCNLQYVALVLGKFEPVVPLLIQSQKRPQSRNYDLHKGVLL